MTTPLHTEALAQGATMELFHAQGGSVALMSTPERGADRFAAADCQFDAGMELAGMNDTSFRTFASKACQHSRGRLKLIVQAALWVQDALQSPLSGGCDLFFTPGVPESDVRARFKQLFASTVPAP